MVFHGKSDGLLLGLVALGLSMAALPAANAESSFSQDVYPVIEIRCLSCHVPGGAGYEASGLDMRTYESLMKGSTHGPMIVPGNVGESNLLAMIEGKAAIRMPHNQKRLSKCERLAFRSWVQQGAQDN